MQVEHIMIHMLDTATNSCVYANEELILNEECVINFINQKIGKVFTNAQRKPSFFEPESTFMKELERYRLKEICFIEISIWMAKHLYEIKGNCGIYESSAFLIAEVVDEGRRYFVGMDQTYKQAISCYIDELRQSNALFMKPILSANILKSDFVFMIEMSDFELMVIEGKRELQGELFTVLSKRFLQASTTPSFHETRKVMEQVGKMMSEKYELDPIKVLPKMKQMMKEAVECQAEIEVDEIAETIFHEVPYAKELFVEEVKKAGIMPKVSTEHHHLAKSGKVQKFMTDSKIEIILPVEYMSEKDKFEIIEHADGTISIQIKNITQLKSK